MHLETRGDLFKAEMMSDWTSGYVADVEYTHGYYPELNPARVEMAMLNAGWNSGKISTACELGFGQGLSTNIHAAASNVQWYGTDFNPVQAYAAQQMSSAAGLETHLYDQAFEEFVHRDDLPDFDFIALHGIWSWISEDNRKIILDFLHRKLKVGGVVYISYNTLPGWSAFAPMRHLMTRHSEVLGQKGAGTLSRVTEAVEFAQGLMDVTSAYGSAYPQVKDKLKELNEKPAAYLAHEYFNKDWQPMYFLDVADRMSANKLTYAQSAAYVEHISQVNYTPDQLTILNSIPDRLFREGVGDLLMNRQFRKDYWIRGGRQLSPAEQRVRLQDLKVVLQSTETAPPKTLNTNIGTVNLQPQIYDYVFNELSEGVVKTIGDLAQSAESAGLTFPQVHQAITLLVAAGVIAPAQESSNVKKIKNNCMKLNAYIIEQADFHNHLGFLASPTTGGAVGVNRFQQLFIGCYQAGERNPEKWAEIVWKIISAQGQKIVKSGKTLETDEQNLSELNRMAAEFADRPMHVLQVHGVVG